MSGVTILVTQRGYYIAGACILATSLAVRLISYPVISADYTASLSHWMQALSGSPGLTAFRTPFSDYPPLYLYVLKLLTYIPANNLYAIKTASLVFDVLLAFFMCRIVALFTDKNRGRIFLTFAIAVSIPTVLLNSSLWAQSDAAYAACVVGCLYYVLRNKPYAAAFMFGLALSLKLQSVFFAPIILGYLAAQSKGWKAFLLIPATYVILLVPAVAAGGSLSQLLTVYFRQSTEFSDLSLSAPTVFALIGDPGQGTFTHTALAAAGIIVAGLATIYMAMRAYEFVRRRASLHLLFLAFLSVALIPFFLPHMHERYFYLADVLSVLFALVRPRYWPMAAGIVIASFFSYMPFLSGSVSGFGKLVSPMAYFGLLMLAVLVCALYALAKFTKDLSKPMV